MKKKQKIIILILIGIIIILGSVFLYQGLQVTQNKADYFELKDGWHIEINDTVYENMSLGDFLFPSVDKGDEIRMRCTLPRENLVKNPVLRVYTVHSTLEVRYNNQIKYLYGKDLKEENKLLGYGYNFIHIPDYYAGAEIELIMQITEDDAFSSINVPQICNSDTVIRDFVMKNRVPLAVNMFLIVFGVLVVLVSAIFSSKNKKFLKLLCVGFFSLGIGCWSLCNYDLIILFTYDLRVKAYLEFGALYLVPLFVLLYFRRDDFIIRKRVINISYQVMLVMQICFDILAFALQFFNIVHFPKMLKIQHFILFVLCIGIISLTIYDFIKKQIHNKALIIGMTIMLIIGLLDMMKFTVLKYFVPMEKLQYVSIMCIGAMIFVLSQLVDFCVEIGQILLTGAKAQVLEEMAYHDDMTGIANRRRCEELWDSLDESRNNYGIFAFDLYFLKKTNDTKGHAMGDFLIQSFAQVLSKIFQEVGVVGRIGGDEFVVIIPDMNNVDKQELTKQLEEEIKRTNMENPDLHLSTAYGFCSHDEYPDFDSRKIYRKADEFMYEKKVAMKAARTD